MNFIIFFALLVFFTSTQINADDLALDNFQSGSDSGYSRDDGWTNVLKIEGKKKSSKTYTFDSSYVSTEVTITFDMKYKGDWEGSGKWQDYFKVYLNDTQSVDDTYDGDSSSWESYSLTATTDANARLKIEFYKTFLVLFHAQINKSMHACHSMTMIS